MVLAPAALGVSAGPARAEATLKVEAGYGGGQFMPGRQVPVRVTITADRLVRGTLQLSLDVGGESGVFPLSLPVEIAGGTSKEVLVAMPTVAGVDRAEVVVTLSRANLRGEAQLGFDGSTDLVGLLPDLVQRVPQAETFPGDLGVARFAQLEENELDTPGALDPLGTIVSAADGLDSLSDTARRNVLAWLEQGGRLVVDGHPGDRVGGLPDAWQPGELTRSAAGRGEVRFSSGAAGEGRWADVVEPTPLVLAGDVLTSGTFGPQSLPEAVGLDGGLRIPTVGWLLGFLVLYVLIVGPAVFLLLRLRGRVNWIWLSVASLAVLFAAGAFVVGNDLRSGSEVSHGTLVHTGPAGARASTFVGLVSRSGADGRASFPDGWSASGLTSVVGSQSMIIDSDPWGGGQGLSVSPASVRIDGGGTRGDVDLDPGGFGMVSGWGALEQTEGLEVTAEAAADGSIRGTVRNASAVTLDEVVVVVGMRSWGADEPLAPGEQADWTLPPTDGLSAGGGPIETSWQEASGWDGEPPRSTPINYALWSATVLQHADPYPTGLAVAAGWTRGWTPPVDVGGPIEKGRTVFTSEAPVTAVAGSAPMPAIRRDYLRGSQGTPIDGSDVPAVEEQLDSEWGVRVEGAVVSFVLPPTAGADQPSLRALLPANVLRMELWDGDSWEPQQRRETGTDAPLDDEVLPANYEPWDTRIRSVADIPAEVAADGVVYVRVTMADTSMGGDTGPGVLLGPADP